MADTRSNQKPDAKKLRQQYRTIHKDEFPPIIRISFESKPDGRSLPADRDPADNRAAQTHSNSLCFEKVEWEIDGERRGLRYGDNPDQPAALYRLVSPPLKPSNGAPIPSDHPLISDAALLQSGKHPGKINITDIDSALSILRYITSTPCAVIIKHNNPCGVALAPASEPTIGAAYRRALAADRIAAFGGTVVLNRTVDADTARQIADFYIESVAAPDFVQEALSIFAARKNMRVLRIPAIANLAEYAPARTLEMSSLRDGGMILQWSYKSNITSPHDFILAETDYQQRRYLIARAPTPREYEDLLFGWHICAGTISNSIVYVKNGVTLGICAGEQDRVGAAQIARDKAYLKLAHQIAFERHEARYDHLPSDTQKKIWDEVSACNGGLRGSIMISDAFFPFRDAVDIGIAEGVSAIAQPGGSLRDFESIEACNEQNVAMVFTTQRSFRH